MMFIYEITYFTHTNINPYSNFSFLGIVHIWFTVYGYNRMLWRHIAAALRPKHGSVWRHAIRECDRGGPETAQNRYTLLMASVTTHRTLFPIYGNVLIYLAVHRCVRRYLATDRWGRCSEYLEAANRSIPI